MSDLEQARMELDSQRHQLDSLLRRVYPALYGKGDIVPNTEEALRGLQALIPTTTEAAVKVAEGIRTELFPELAAFAETTLAAAIKVTHLEKKSVGTT